ncbi:TonB-dependent receptor [bacterium]|nr:TonB-dependent receptor [bacterium]
MDKYRTLTLKEKALSINLDSKIYGSFSEIGAGQEVAANFFQAGGASGTIAHSTSAYDMKISDSLYGEARRYVCEDRLVTMLHTEFKQLNEKLPHRADDSKFFSFADTVETINYHKSNQGHGWMGIRFQLRPHGPVNDVVLHVKMHDNVALLQQKALGRLGVNLIYAAFHYYQNPEKFLLSLVDGIDGGRLEIDMLRFEGSDFEYIDNRLMALQLVKMGFTEATIFEPDGNVHQPADVLYKKNVLVLRGRFRPVTWVNLDMFHKGLDMFKADEDVDPENVVCLFELTLKDLKAGGNIDPKDFLDRIDTLRTLGHRVLISNYVKYYKLVQYLSGITKGKKVGVVLGHKNIETVFDESFYNNLTGGILEAFGLGFGNKVKMMVYPELDPATQELRFGTELNVSHNLRGLFQYLIDNQKLVDIRNANKEIMYIFSDDVLHMIKTGKKGWEKMVPDSVAAVIKEHQLFNYVDSEVAV